MSLMHEAQELSLFLGTNNMFREKLKARLREIVGYEDVLCDVVSACQQAYEHKMYVLPREKHSLVKVCERVNIFFIGIIYC